MNSTSRELRGREVDLRTAGDLSPDVRYDAVAKALRSPQIGFRQGLEDDQILRLAVTELDEIVGEAAKQVGEPTCNAHPSAPWSAAAGLRDRLTHHDVDVGLDVRSETITEGLPRRCSPRCPTNDQRADADR